MKKILTLTTALALTLGLLAGCGGKQDQPSAPGGDASGESAATETGAGEEVTLTVAARGGLHVDAMTAVKEAFEKENNCKIEILGLEADDLKQKIALDSANAEGTYDLAMADDPWMPELLESDIFLNLTQEGLEDDADFIPASLALGKNPYGTGDTYALPFAGNVQLMFYNKDLIESNAGEAPTDWAGVLKTAQAIKDAGKLGYVIRGQQGNPIVSDYLPILWAYGGKVFTDDWQVTVDSPEAVEALKTYIALLATGENYEKNDLVSAVSEGEAGMALGWPSWFISGSDATAAYAPIPSKKDASAASQKTGMIGHWMMGVPKNAPHKDLALKFLTFITSADTQKAMADHGGVPTRTSVYDDKDLVEKYPFYPILKEATEQSVVRPRTPLWSEIETVYGAELSAAVSGEKTPEEALAQAKTAIEDIMK